MPPPSEAVRLCILEFNVEYQIDPAIEAKGQTVETLRAKAIPA